MLICKCKVFSTNRNNLSFYTCWNVDCPTVLNGPRACRRKRMGIYIYSIFIPHIYSCEICKDTPCILQVVLLLSWAWASACKKCVTLKLFYCFDIFCLLDLMLTPIKRHNWIRTYCICDIAIVYYNMKNNNIKYLLWEKKWRRKKR